MRYVCRGIPLKLIVDDLAAKWKVDKSAIYADWERRDTWIRTIVELDKSLFYLMFQGLGNNCRGVGSV